MMLPIAMLDPTPMAMIARQSMKKPKTYTDQDTIIVDCLGC